MRWNPQSLVEAYSDTALFSQVTEHSFHGHSSGPPDFPGWAARKIETEADVSDVIELLRLNYDRVSASMRLAGFEPAANGLEG